MHPAYSVIIFTTASGAGYGLLVLLALAGVGGFLAPDRGLGLWGFGIALALITAGLLASTLHLGRPERAWRALSEWRTSWLSREGVVAIATYPAAGVAGLGWVLLERVDGVFAVAAALAAALALATVACTGQIYHSLETIPRWHQPTTTPIYLALSLATGGLLLTALLALLGMPIRPVAIVTLVVLVLAAVLKIVYWRSIDGRKRRYSIEAATGLGAFGSVRVLDPPHTQPNYVMREMGYAVGRRHARRLRLLTLACLFAIPVALTLLGLASPGLPATVAAGLAVASASLGVLTERWLFFAEAEHVSMLYYGRAEV